MTAHDLRVTLTQAEIERLCDALEDCDAEYRVEQRVAREVEHLIAARLAPIRALVDEWERTTTGRSRPAFLVAADELRAALEATEADLSASQDHDETEGQDEECRPCCDAHPTQGCADVGCRHDCEGWIERFEERLR